MNMENQLPTIDVLLYQDDPITLSLQRVLQRYQDITLFTRKDIGDIIPDIIIFTEIDPYRCVMNLRNMLPAYHKARPVYMRKYFDSVSIGLMQYVGVIDLLSTDLKPEELYFSLKTIGISPITALTQKKVTKFYNKYYDYLRTDGLTFKQSMVLGARVRGYSWPKTKLLLGMNQMRFRMECNLAKKKLGLNTKTLRDLKYVFRYGGIMVEGKFKKYNIYRRDRIKNPGYYIIPRTIVGDSTEK